MNFLKVLLVSLIIITISGCAEKKPQVLKEFYAENIQEFIRKMQNYQSLESSLTIDYESKGSLLSGDAALKIYKNETLLRVYYMGFPVGEVYEKEGEFSSNLPMEKDKIIQILTGIKRGFMWWNGDFEVIENEKNFILRERESDREIVLTKNGFMPVSQTFTFENQKIFIVYEDFKEFQTHDNTTLIMPSQIIVYYKNKNLKIRIEKLKLING
ncbi:MAG: hypothetical protein QMD43_00055 [Thermodesulfovibrio sp.]|jgi:hypothetical protein|uniref:hypothetical protein n=1 Tax=unclassified Thermodesulfovibrio TaxID=2645936 RepID=UPI00083A9C3D|nr:MULTISPECIES: hypothetical protein [unclassified Thermodesulfovibrio]MDI1472703.1 hypothetical protein [Thermodesulfovibrio sp. 1176]MDI6713401.1 hypothetical protein [Thermodesulfovibrio sp.]ODA43892.1 hypothetical protein THER_1378 [Thermodesulfovibrio sp. N1]